MSGLRGSGLGGIVAILAVVEFTSGVLQGYYTPILTVLVRHLGVHDADANWLEGAQLMLSALVIPAFAKLGDMVGHRRMLLIAMALTAAATAALPFLDAFPPFLLAWAVQGFLTVWLPLQIALIWSRSRRAPRPAAATAAAAGVLVAALQAGAITGALVSGLLIDAVDLRIVLLVPAVLTLACLVVTALGIPADQDAQGGRLDVTGLVLVTLAVAVFTGGLSLIRVTGAGSIGPWAVILLGLALLIPFARWELRCPDPLIDVRMFASPSLGPVLLTAGLFGVSVLGAQAPLSTFARTDPSVTGYGLGTTGFTTSLVIGGYLVAMIIGALLFARVRAAVTPRRALVVAASLVGLGFLLFLPFHHVLWQVQANMAIVGLGSGALVAALPSAAAAAAPRGQTSVATGLTNSVKTVGGAIASAVFGLALLGGTAGAVESTAGSLAGYMTVWIVCGGTGLIAAGLLARVPPDAFSDAASPHEGGPM